jgi:hypothetical protein
MKFGNIQAVGQVVSTGSVIITGSAQVVYSGLTGIPSGIVSGSGQIPSLLPSGVVSGSAQTLANLPSGTVSGSAQVDVMSTTNIARLATTGSNTFSGNQTINGSLIVTGSLTAQQFIVSSSVTYLTESFASGSHKFGDSSDDTHQFTGSVYISGSVVTLTNSTLTSTGSDARIYSFSNDAGGSTAGFTAQSTAANGGFHLVSPVSGSTSHVTTVSNYDTYLSTRNANNLILATANVERIRIGGGGGVAVTGSLTTTGNVGIGISDLGPDGLSLPGTFNYSWSEGSGNAYAVLFRQRNSAATVMASGYKRSGTGTFASSYGISMARAAIAVGYNNGSIAFFSDTASNVANGTDITPTERMTLNSSGNLTVTGTINGLSIPNDLFAQQFLLMGS